MNTTKETKEESVEEKFKRLVKSGDSGQNIKLHSVKLISTTGRPGDTHVFIDGQAVKGLQSININAAVGQIFPEVTLTILTNDLDYFSLSDIREVAVKRH